MESNSKVVTMLIEDIEVMMMVNKQVLEYSSTAGCENEHVIYRVYC